MTGLAIGAIDNPSHSIVRAGSELQDSGRGGRPNRSYHALLAEGGTGHSIVRTEIES